MLEAASLARPVGSGEGLRLSIGAVRSGRPVPVGPRARATSALANDRGVASPSDLPTRSRSRRRRTRETSRRKPSGRRWQATRRRTEAVVRRPRASPVDVGDAAERLARERVERAVSFRLRRAPRVRPGRRSAFFGERRPHGRSAVPRATPRSRRDGAVASSGRCAGGGRLRQRRSRAKAQSEESRTCRLRIGRGRFAPSASPTRAGQVGRVRPTAGRNDPDVVVIGSRPAPNGSRLAKGPKGCAASGSSERRPDGPSTADGAGARTLERLVARTFPRR